MAKSYQDRLMEADNYIKTKHQEIKNSPHRLGYHIAAPANWINDPNGLIQYNGEYHVFYQHHPYDENWGPMYWGHVKSKDLVHWEHYPIALAPFEEYDKDGCFSGSAVNNDGVLTLIYTGNVWLKEDHSELKQVQCLATSENGIDFTKSLHNPILSEIPRAGSSHIRDPKVWKHDDTWYMVLGSKQNGQGNVLFYKSNDLISWNYLGVLAENKGENLGFMWECPDFFKLGNKHILLISPEGMETEGEKYQSLKQTGYFVGDFDYETNTFEHGEFHELDFGHDFYAAQTFKDEKGRRILIAWMDMWESEMPTKKDGWAGALTLPRELVLSGTGKVLMKPVEELNLLRQEKIVQTEKLVVKDELVVAKGERLEIKCSVSLTHSTAQELGLKFRCGKEEETVLSYRIAEQKLTLNRERSGEGPKDIRTARVESDSEQLELTIFLDSSSIEVFVNGGETVLTSRIYPSKESQDLKIFAEEGTASIDMLSVWVLKDTWK